MLKRQEASATVKHIHLLFLINGKTNKKNGGMEKHVLCELTALNTIVILLFITVNLF